MHLLTGTIIYCTTAYNYGIKFGTHQENSYWSFVGLRIILYYFQLRGKMKLQNRITLVVLAATFIISLLVALSDGGSDSFIWIFAAYFGIGCLIVGVVSTLIGLMMLLTKEKEWGQGFLIAGAWALLAGFLSCSGTWMTFKLH